MSKRIVKIIECDRCGKLIELAFDGTTDIPPSDTWTHLRFEEPPAGWSRELIRGLGYIYLCPSCCDDYERFVRDFLDDYKRGERLGECDE